MNSTTCDLEWASKAFLPTIQSDVTASILIIGNEILSGHTKDQNINFLTRKLNENLIDVLEVRVVKDNKDSIIHALNSMYKSANYIFTTGGIGPTHDDITVEAIAEALGITLELNTEAIKILHKYYNTNDLSLMHLKMANLPSGAKLINATHDYISGFRIYNIFVLAGIPKLMQDTFIKILPDLNKGSNIYFKEIVWQGEEVKIAKQMKHFQEKYYATVMIGIYPSHDDFSHIKITLKSTNKNKCKLAYEDIKNYLSN